MTAQKDACLHIGSSFLQKDTESCALPARMCATTFFFPESGVRDY